LSVAPIIPSEHDLPQQIQTAIKERGDVVKSALARAAVPMPPVDLVATLAVLAHDKDKELSSEARETIAAIPFGVKEDGIKATKSPAVLDSLLRLGKLDSDLLISILRNPACDDTTFEFFAENGRGPAMGIIAANQLRFVRHPQIIRALYYNPNTGMDMVSRVIETAVRAGADLSIIPGWKQIVESIMGARFAQDNRPGPEQKKPEPSQEPESGDEPVSVAPDIEPINVEEEPIDENAMERALRLALAEIDDIETRESISEQDEEEEFLMLLLKAAQNEEATADNEEEEEEEDKSLWMKIEHMKVPEKVRLALVGSAFARSILIRDQRRPVYMAVLESPKISENEIVSYASDKGLNEELIRRIARNKEWTRLYSVKKALILNPKTPPITATQLLKYLTKRDLRLLSKSHDVPGYVSRKARQLAQGENEGS